MICYIIAEIGSFVYF